MENPENDHMNVECDYSLLICPINESFLFINKNVLRSLN